MKFGLFGYNIKTGKDATTPVIENVTVAQPKKSKLGETIQDQQIFRARQNIADWRQAIDFAEQITTPNRIELIRIYNDIILDPHLSAVIQTRKINITGKGHNILNANGEFDEESTKIFQSSWFRKFTELAMDSLFWGTTLIEFGDIVDNELNDIERIKYENLNPELKLVKKTIYDTSQGTKYDVLPFSKWSVEILEQEKFGLLNKCVPLVIWKKGAVGAWSIRSDIFGMPLRIGKTDTRDEESRGKMIEMMTNMNKATWGVFDLEDTIEFIETSGTAGHDIYKDLCDKMNGEISKLILGQTGTTDEKAFVGSAEVHERVGNAYTRSDMDWFTNLVNDKLIPKLTALNVLKEGVVFEFNTKETLSTMQQLEVDKELLKFYTIPVDVIKERYNTVVEEKATPAPPTGGLEPSNVSIINDVSKMYEGFFKTDSKCC
jgi:hypothetical protein